MQITVSAIAAGRLTSAVGAGSHSGLWPLGMTSIQLQTSRKMKIVTASGTNRRPLRDADRRVGQLLHLLDQHLPEQLQLARDAVGGARRAP